MQPGGLTVLISGAGIAGATLAALLVLPYLAFFVATLHISDYVSYRDVFHAGEAVGTEQ